MSWPWNRGQRSLKVIVKVILYTGYGFLLVFYSNYVPNKHRFWDIPIRLQKWRDLENRVMGLSRSLEMSPFDFLLTSHSNYDSI